MRLDRSSGRLAGEGMMSSSDGRERPDEPPIEPDVEPHAPSADEPGVAPHTQPVVDPYDDLMFRPRGPRIRKAMSRRTRNLLSWSWVVVTAVVLALLMRTFLVAAFFIPSESMEPVLQVGDRLLVSKLSYRIGDPDPGDIVVFRTPAALPGAETDELIKRVVAVGGQTVEGDGGRLFVDGSPVVEDYLPEGTFTRAFGPVFVPRGHVFVMGDNRPSSQDSRFFGAVPESQIVGRAFARFWPPVRIGGM